MMLSLERRINAFVTLGNKISFLADNFEKDEVFLTILRKANVANMWFIISNQLKAIKAIAEMLNENDLRTWLINYPQLETLDFKLQTVGVISAGNIPAVAFHDVMCVLMSGHNLHIKLSSDDAVLMQFVLDLLMEIEPAFKSKINVAEKIKDVDAVIATGSNNSARYFEYYFKNIPHIIRKNRNGVAVLSGNETKEELYQLGEDMFAYFGLGCRNVSKVFVPKGYVFNTLFESIEPFGKEMMEHNKYMNNFDYHNALFLLEAIPYLTNNFLIVKEDSSFSSPVSVLHYEYYNDKESLKNILSANAEKIQCIVSKEKLLGNEVDFGHAQHPAVGDYADGVDTMQFLTGI